MVVTPGDILARCRSIGARITVADEAIRQHPAAFDAAFVSAWQSRLRRWHEIRSQCGDWGSRWWNWKWGPILDDWSTNQGDWERMIEARTGRPLDVPPIARDETPLDAGGELAVAVQVGVAALGVLAAVAVARAVGKR